MSTELGTFAKGVHGDRHKPGGPDDLSPHYARKGYTPAVTKTGSYTITPAGMGGVIEVDAAADSAVRFPLDQAASIPVGSFVDVARVGAGRVLTEPVLRNFVPNPSMEAGSSDYALRNGSLARVADAAIFGGFGLRATSTAVGQAFGWFGPVITLAEAGLAVGEVVSARINFRASDVGGVLSIRFRSGTSMISETSSTPVMNGVAVVENKTIPPGCDNIFIVSTSLASTAVGQTVDSDGLMLVRGATAPTAYVDGDTAGHGWAGAAHASQSMGPLVRGLGFTLPRYGRTRVRKRAANEWVVEDQPPAEVLTDRDQLRSDRDNGQAGMVAPSMQLFSATSLALTANRCYLARFVPSRDMSVTRLGFRVVTASATDDPCDVGIYDAAMTRLVSSGATLGRLNSTGSKQITVPTTLLTAGTVYYAALATTSAANLTHAVGVGDGFGFTPPAADLLAKAATYPLPATLTGLGGADAAPILWVRET